MGAAEASQATHKHRGVWEEVIAPRGESQLTWFCQDAVATMGVMGRGHALNWCWNPALTPGLPATLRVTVQSSISQASVVFGNMGFLHWVL